MWVGKFKIKHDDWILSETLQYNISARGIPLGSFSKNGKSYHTGVVILYGDTENKQAFLNSLKTNSRVAQYTTKGDQLFVLVEGSDAISLVFDHSLFFVEPVLMKKGYEIWHLGSWQKETLSTFFANVQKIAEVEMLKLNEGSPGIFVQHAIPTLTKKQQEAIYLAVHEGYYSYPRKISIEKLAKLANTSRSTFQEHLHKAESKLMRILLPF